jgi:hypothetical protein
MSDVFEGLDAPETEVAAPEAAAPEVKEPAKEPAKEAAPAAKEPDKKEEPRTIPLAAHLEERNKLRSEIEEERKSRKALEERLAKLENPPPPPKEKPDFITDPRGYVDETVNSGVQTALQKLQEIEQRVEKTGKTAEEAAQESRMNAFLNHLGGLEAEFRTKAPDYSDALEHLRKVRVAEIQLLNPAVTQEQLIQIIRNEEIQLAMGLAQAGKNPHEVAYQLAQARGYAKKAPTPELKLPEVKGGPQQLPPDQTLGSASGNAPEEKDEENPDGLDAFDAAFKQMFSRKRA